MQEITYIYAVLEFTAPPPKFKALFSDLPFSVRGHIYFITIANVTK